MILKNDLSKNSTAKKGSVEVTELCAFIRFAVGAPNDHDNYIKIRP
jgi:hypothetical protein